MREKSSIRSLWGAPAMALALAVFLAGRGATRAEDASADWYQEDGNWKSKTLPTGDIFQIRLDGRSFIVKKNESGPNPAQPKNDKYPTYPKVSFAYEGKPISVRREMLYDRSRQAIRILDIFTNTDANERRIRVEYSTNLGQRGGVHYNGVLMPDGSSREYGQGVPDDAPGAIVLAEREGSDAVPLFLWGQRDSKWHGRVRDIGSSLSLSYEEVLPAGGKAALLHWVATAGLERGVRLEQGFDKFFKGGRLVQPLVPDDIVPVIGNFQPEAFQQDATPEPVTNSSTHRLVLLEDLCERLKLKREAKDILFLGTDQKLTGDAGIEKISVVTRGKTLQPAVSEVAAIMGGAGVGRLHHLFLRTGEVLAGQVTLAGGSLETTTGRIALSADAVDLLLLRTQPQDGQWPGSVSGYVQTSQGELFWLAQPPTTLNLAASFGAIALPVWQVERRKEPAVSLTVLLDDGSRIQGAAAENTLPFVLQRGELGFSVGEVTRWGVADAIEKAAPDGEAVKLLTDHHCTLRDGSIIAGALADETLRLSTAAGETTIKVEEMVRMDCKGSEDCTVELASGTKIKGALLTDVLHWKRQEQAIAIPSSLVTELVKKGGATAPQTTSTSPKPSTAPPKA